MSFEKVNPCHPDKVADRIAGAIVDMAYARVENPHIAVEVLIGHGLCTIITESDITLSKAAIRKAVSRIAGKGLRLKWVNVQQDKHLNGNQQGAIRCGDNGIFKGMPTTDEQKYLSAIAHDIYRSVPSDGKYIWDADERRLIICQSNTRRDWLKQTYKQAVVNPLGDWTGGTDVDTGATNRKLGSDMGDAVTGGGLHGKDLSKADVSVNIWCHLKAQETGEPYAAMCAIGDTEINGVPYADIVKTARDYIWSLGGFEKFAEWGLI